MVDILSKISTHRRAVAKATLCVSSIDTINAVKNKLVPKGDVIEMSKTAGLLAIKKTSDVIPDCHPMPVEYAKITHEINELQINVYTEVHTIYKTGVEVEAMYGASVTAMTMYDMLKPIDKGITIEKIQLMEKSGGKTDFVKDTGASLSVGIVLYSKPIATGKKTDATGQLINNAMKKYKLTINDYTILDETPDKLVGKINELVKNTDLIIISGGTGLTKNDQTPQLIKPMLDYEIPGIMEWARSYGQSRTPYSMFSRSFAGIINGKLLIAMPGSTNGVKETVDALFPYVLHAYKMLKH